MHAEDLLALLRSEVVPATGCTEPGAVALAAAYAAEGFTEQVLGIDVSVNSNVYKNGVAVGIPGTGETGLEIAAALGCVKRCPEKQLSVLEGVTPEELAQARKLLQAGTVQVRVDEDKEDLWVEVVLRGPSLTRRAVIADRHTNLILLEEGERVLFRAADGPQEEAEDARKILRDGDVTLRQLIQAVEAIPAEELGFLEAGAEMNQQAAAVGIEKRLGMGIGAIFSDMISQGLLSDDVVNSAKIKTAGAADARMSGENIRVMSSAGSGNHGITVILPVVAVAQKIGAPRDRLLRALAISHLVTVYIKMHTGSLSALCGCAVAAATGATAAITWLMGHDAKAIEAAMKNVIANLTGMICDGGKVGCALKLATAAATAVESSLLAQHNIVVPDTNGIIDGTIEATIRNLGRISNPGMVQTDREITGVMLEKQVKSRG